MQQSLYFNIDIIYLLVNFIMLATFYVCGKNISNGKTYSKNVIICIIIYTLCLGLRYGRGWDYNHYIDVYKYNLEETEIVFTYFNIFLKKIGVGSHYFFLVYNLIEITCAFVFLYPFKKFARYIFPLFMIATLHLNEYSIRQGLAFSFVFLSLFLFFRFYDKLKGFVKHYKIFLLLIVCIAIAYGIHSVTIITLSWIFVFAIFIKKPLPYKITIFAFILASYVFQNMFDFSALNGIFSFMADQNEKYAQYIENSDIWFGAEGFNESYTRNPIIKIFETLGNMSLFYLGYKVVSNHFKTNRQVITLYNVFVIGSIAQKFFLNFEILNRVCGTGVLFWCLPLGLILYYYRDFYKYRLWLILLIWWSYEYLKYLFMCGDMCHFLWETNYL